MWGMDGLLDVVCMLVHVRVCDQACVIMFRYVYR